MRTPKIGDIVHYHSSNNGFIPIICKVVHVKEPPLRLYLKDTNNGFAFVWEEGSYLCFSDYWSWPEEEKQCEHRWTNLAKDKTPYENGQIVCVYCNQLDQIKEEKPVYTKPFQPVFEFGMSAGGSGGREEEKQECQHKYEDICLPKMPPVYQKKCSKCGDVKQETPKECEHDYISVYQVKCSKCNHIEIEASNQYFVPAAKKMAKAGELIEKIWGLSLQVKEPWNNYHSINFIQDVDDLIKEYKGIKC